MATKRKSLPPHWYLIYITECPVCGRGREERIRQFTPKPKDVVDRYDYMQVYDYCQEF